MRLYGTTRRFHVETLHERGRNPRRTDRPRPESGRLGRGGGKPGAARGHHPRPAAGRRHAGCPGHRRLRADLPQPQARRDRGQAAGPARYRRRRPGQEIRREAAGPLRLLHQWRRHLPGRHDDRRGAVRHRIPHPGRTLEPRLRRAERLARPLRRHPVRGQGRLLAGALLPGHRHQARAGSHCRGPGPHPADPGDRHRQDLHRLPARLEAVPEPMEPRRLEARSRTHPTPAHPVPGRPQHPRRPGLQRVLGLPGRRARADRSRDHPQEGPRAEERQHLLHHLPDLHDRPRCGRPARAELRRLPARLLRLHRHRRMPSRRRERRRQLARHPELLRASRAARPDRDAEAPGQRRYLRLFRRPGLHLLPEGRDQRRLPHAIQGPADRHHARRLRLYQRRRGDRGRGRARAALHRKRLQPHHRDHRARAASREAVHGR